MIENLIIEKPISWMRTGSLAPYVVAVYDQLYSFGMSLGLRIKEKEVYFHKKTDNLLTFYNRTPVVSQNTLYLSYHTFGYYQKNLWRIKESYLPGYFSVDTKGYSGFSNFANTQKENINNNTYTYTKNDVEIFISNISSRFQQKNVSKYTQPKTDKNFSDTDYIFFPLQIYNDTVISLSRIEYYQAIHSVATQIKNHKIVIKQHPRDKNKKVTDLLIELTRHHSNIIISDLSIHQLIPSAKCCITINSGVGFESLIYGIPCITLGKSDYDSCTLRCSSVSEIDDNLINLAINNYDYNYVKLFLYYYLNRYCINMYDHNSTKNKLLEILNKEQS